MKKLDVVVIGCGNIFPAHADAIVENTKSNLLAVVDVDEEKASEGAEKYKCKFYIDHHQLLANEKIDIVHICTPHYLHAPIAIDFLKAGIDVLVEKPLAINTASAEQMICAAEKYGRRIGVVFQNRFNKNVLKAQEILSTGRLGKIKGIKGILTWYRDEKYYNQSEWRGKFSTEGGGVLINQAIHTLDLMQLFGGKVIDLKGHVSTRCLDFIEVEDTADATFFFESGAVGIFYATNCFSSNSPVHIEIECEKGRLILDGSDLGLELDDEFQEFNDDSCNNYKSYWGHSHKTLIDSFYQDILEKSNKYIVTAQDGIESLRIIEKIYESSKSGKKEKI